jgi:hypothetical protein
MSIFNGLRRLVAGGSVTARSSASAPPDRVIACSAVAPAMPRIFPTLAAALGAGGQYVPAALVAQKARSISDGVMAALDQASTNGDGGHPGVMRWLEELERALGSRPAGAEPAGDGAFERIWAALDIARTGSTRRAVAQDMLARPLRSRPLGLYAWSDELARAFVRDRFLQEALPDAEARALARVIEERAELREPYHRHLQRIARLTDRLARPGIGLGVSVRAGVGLGAAGTAKLEDPREAVFPASVAIDNRYGGGRAFLEAVKSGRCDLTPDPDSGFYQHQLFALTALLLPEKTAEARRRLIDPAYAEALGELAALGLFFARETHVKQLEILEIAERARRFRRTVYPSLTVEPVPTFYRLTGDAFRFLRRVVADGWGEASLGLPQVRDEGPIAQTIAAGIDEMTELCDAATEVSSRELEGDADDSRCEALRARLRGLRSDEDAIGDVRGMVPIAHDDAGRVLAIVFLGWELHTLDVRLTRLKGAGKDVEFGTETYPLPIPFVREVAIAPAALADRRAFRAACDRIARETAGEVPKAGGEF